MQNLDKLRESLPEAAKDIKINLSSVLSGSSLDAGQSWGVAVACAYALRQNELRAALIADAQAAGIEAGVLEDAKAAAILMSMNNVYYRFRHLVGKEEYSQKPPRLRMQRMAQLQSSKALFELFSLAVSAINNCQFCVASHEAQLLGHGISQDQVHDAVRIAATMTAAAVALEAR